MANHIARRPDRFGHRAPARPRHHRRTAPGSGPDPRLHPHPRAADRPQRALLRHRPPARRRRTRPPRAGLLRHRREVVRAGADIPAHTALVIPTARRAAGRPSHGIAVAAWQAWSFEHAADRLVATATVSPQGRFVIHIPDLAPEPTVGEAGTRAPAAKDVLLARLHSLLTDRNSTHAHRRAARGRLSLSPSRIRQRVDHHFAPAELVRRFADRYHVLAAPRPLA